MNTTTPLRPISTVSKLYNTGLALWLSIAIVSAPFAAPQAFATPVSSGEQSTTVTPVEVVESLAAIPEIVPSSPTEFTLQTARGYTYAFPNETKNSEWLVQFKSMAPEAQIKFQEQRTFLLSRAAAILDHTELTLGFGSLIKNKIKQVFSKRKATQAQNQPLTQPIDALANQSLNAQADGTDARPAQNFVSKNTAPRSALRERGHAIVERILTAIDARLWQQAPIVSRQNEVSVSVTLNLVGMVGLGQKVGGGSAGLGFSIGYNRENRAVVFEIFTEVEKMHRSFTPTFLAGLTPKVGVRLTDIKDGRARPSRAGQTVYPPGVPGYMLNHSDQVEMGMNGSFMAFPPIVGDLFSYLNNNSRQLLMRISISPVLNKFVQMQVGAIGAGVSNSASDSNGAGDSGDTRGAADSLENSKPKVWSSITGAANSVGQKVKSTCSWLLSRKL